MYQQAKNHEIELENVKVEYENQLGVLKAIVADVQNTTTVYRAIFDIDRGIDLTEAMWEAFEMPTSSVTDDFIVNPTDLDGAFPLVPLRAKTPLTKSLLGFDHLAATDRYIDIVLHEYYVGMKDGDFIDVRFINSAGQSMIVFNKKRIISVNGTTLKVIFNEEEYNRYESALVDSFLTPGATLKAMQYVEPAYQDASIPFYPISNFVVAQMRLNPNLRDIAYDSVVERRRELFENNAFFDDTIAQILESGREEVVNAVNEDMTTERAAREVAEKEAEQGAASAEGEPELDEWGDPIPTE